jgi:hypothetical protein
MNKIAIGSLFLSLMLVLLFAASPAEARHCRKTVAFGFGSTYVAPAPVYVVRPAYQPIYVNEPGIMYASPAAIPVMPSPYYAYPAPAPSYYNNVSFGWSWR